MSWLRVDDDFPHHPKVMALSAQAVALWLAACCWSSRYETDGHLPSEIVKRLPWHAPEAVAELVAAGLWEGSEGGWQIHDFLKFNPSREQREGKRVAWRERQAQHRAKGKNSTVTQPVTLGQPSDSTRESRVSQGNGEGEELDLFNLSRGSAEGGQPEPKPPAPDAAACRVLAALNAGRKRAIQGARDLRPTETNLKHIGDRLREGHSLEDCEHVIAVFEADVRADAAKGKWFNHETPFRPDNFARALGRPVQAGGAVRRNEVMGTRNRPTWSVNE